VLIGLFVVIKLQHNLVMLLDKCLPKGKFKEKILGLVHNFIDGFQTIKNPVMITKILGLTFLTWIIYFFTTWLCLTAFDIPLNIFHAALIQSIIAIAFVIPASPGAIGTYEFFSILALMIFRKDFPDIITKANSLSYALVSHFLGWLPVMVLGLIVLLKSGLTFKQIEDENIGSEDNTNQKT
jgi:hypothetical protein